MSKIQIALTNGERTAWENGPELEIIFPHEEDVRGWFALRALSAGIESTEVEAAISHYLSAREKVRAALRFEIVVANETQNG